MSVSNFRLVYGDIAEEMIRKDKSVQKAGKDLLCYCVEESAKAWQANKKCKTRQRHGIAVAC